MVQVAYIADTHSFVQFHATEVGINATISSGCLRKQVSGEYRDAGTDDDG